MLTLFERDILNREPELTILDEGDNDLSELIISDKGGRRVHNDRRQFSYTVHIPERRKGNDRRNGGDRRKSTRLSNGGS